MGHIGTRQVATIGENEFEKTDVKFVIRQHGGRTCCEKPETDCDQQNTGRQKTTDILHKYQGI